MNIEKSVQSNQLETLYIDSPGASAASVQIWFRAGSALEKGNDKGIAHFLEHMFFKGTKKRPGAMIAHQVESFGGEVNAFTSFDYTCYYINTPSTHLTDTVDILMDMVSNPSFLDEELVPERDVVFEEYLRAEDNPMQYSFKKLQSQCFTSGYAHQILGTEKTIKSFQRKQLIDFRNKNYSLENCMLIVAGDLSKEKNKLDKIIGKYDFPNGKKTSFPAFKLKDKDSIEVHHKDVRQVTVTFAIQAPNYNDSDAAAEDLAINCLAHGETSRLYKQLVAKSTSASAISGSTMYFSHGGVHFLRVTCPVENVDRVVADFAEVFKVFASSEFSEDEVSKIKNQYIASKVYEKESIEAYAFSLGHGYAQSGDIHCEDEFIDRMRKTSTQEVNSAINVIFSRPIHFCVQIPKTAKNQNIQKSFKSLPALIRKNLIDKKLKNNHKVVTSKFDPTTKKIEIMPGIELIYRHNTMTPTFVMHAYLKGGVMNENEQNCGLHYLIGRTLTYGNKSTKYDELKNDLEKLSASLSGFSGKNAYGLTLHGQTEHANQLMGHFFNTLLTPSLPTKFVSMEKMLIKRSLENQKEDPVKQSFKTFNKLIFNGHHYSLDLIGNTQSLKKLNAKALKEQHQKNLIKSPIQFTFCGDLAEETVVENIKKYLKGLKARKNPKTKLKKNKPILGKEIHLPFEREQTHIFLGTQGESFSGKDDIYLRMFTTYLSGQSSELFVEVRDKQGLCYTVQPVHHSALEAGYWGIYIGTSNEKTKRAIEAIQGLLAKYQKKGLPKSEFERIKSMIDGQNMLTVQTNDDHANLYSISSLHGLGLDHQHEINQAIRNAKYDDFQNYLKKFLNRKWNKIIAGTNN